LWFTFAASDDRDSAGFAADTEDDGLLNPRDEKMSPLARHCVQDSSEPIEDDGPLTPIHCEGETNMNNNNNDGLYLALCDLPHREVLHE